MKRPLYIPVNVPEREDFAAGFGVKELTYTAVALVIGIIIAISIFSYTESGFYSVGVAGALVTTVFMVVRRDRYDESMIDKLRFVKIYLKAQKRYEYKYHNIYEGAEDEEK